MNKKKKKKEKLDKFHYHEAIDRTFIVRDMVEEVLQNHPVLHHPDNKDLFDEIDSIQSRISKIQEELSERSDRLFSN